MQELAHQQYVLARVAHGKAPLKDPQALAEKLDAEASVLHALAVTDAEVVTVTHDLAVAFSFLSSRTRALAAASQADEAAVRTALQDDTTKAEAAFLAGAKRCNVGVGRIPHIGLSGWREVRRRPPAPACHDHREGDREEDPRAPNRSIVVVGLYELMWLC